MREALEASAIKRVCFVEPVSYLCIFARTVLVPKLPFGNDLPKLCFARCNETEFRANGSQTEFGKLDRLCSVTAVADGYRVAPRTAAPLLRCYCGRGIRTPAARARRRVRR